MVAEKQSILVVDDTPENIDVLVGTLKDDYKVKAAINGEMALKISSSAEIDMILLDIMMPGMDGYEVCRRLKEDYLTKHIPVIFVTAKISMQDELKGFDLGAVDYIAKPISPALVQARVKIHLALHDQNRELDAKVQARTKQLNDTRLKIIQRLGKAAEYKDNETGLHVIRMSQYSYILARAAGMSEKDSDILLHAAPMHDIGKIGIPDSILKKPGKLTEEEFDIMKTHCAIGADVLGADDSELLQLAKSVALTHHEKWNGVGYPKGLKDLEIPLEGRIIAIADVFDALTSVRPYKKEWPVQDAIDLLLKEKGKHFDPNLVPIFIKELPKILKVKQKYAEKTVLSQT